MSATKLTAKAEFLAWLEDRGFPHETREHPPLHTVEEAEAHRAGWDARAREGAFCKNLFLKDKKGRLFLIVTEEHRALKLNSLSKPIGSARLSFGNAELMWEVLGVRPGSVTPFALVNDREHRVTAVLDAPMLEHERLNYHPLENTATTALSRADFLRFLRETGHEPLILDLEAAAAGA
ncbi:MAG: prolyl-tRNA synthetase associated domain-containing protein [Alphaproteobacteria bacterium]|nr:prolyl-tRNA synthetase associated domain-containing protein [Alphaproteobacteria bacterium]MDX5415619.1 prolyl-tRNA synthetase associated domain-containing protein [Alphaproteobacteria bacterium]MDX5492879.1 prolyl-tRNA synthetase associated domain-containing protein [Alphaproteobacteria bacterium]